MLLIIWLDNAHCSANLRWVRYLWGLNINSIRESADFKHYKAVSGADVLPSWLSHIKGITAKAVPSTSAYVEGLQLDFWSDTPGHVSWLNKYLHPLLSHEQDQDNREHFKVGQLFADDLVIGVSHFIASGQMDSYSVQSAKGLNTRLVFSSHLIVDFDPEEGMVCVTDLENRAVTLVTSCHGRYYPVQHFSRLVRELITGFLRQEGWLTFHAGAVAVDGKTFLVIGDQGAGKTSLILALLAGGAEYIANERVFVKYKDGKLCTLSSPMAVAVGLGTAMQYPLLKSCITQPTFLAYPPLRLNAERIVNTPESHWAGLPDKLQVFPGELELAFNTRAIAGGEIVGVVFPELSSTQGSHLMDEDLQEAKAIINRNYFSWQNDGVVPSWRPFGFTHLSEESVQPTIDALLELRQIRFSFLATQERFNELRRYKDMLLEFFVSGGARIQGND